MSNGVAHATVVDRPAVTVNGAALPVELEEALIDARVELVSNSLSQATLRFYDANFKFLGSSFKIGSVLEVGFPKPGSTVSQSVFEGTVLELAAEQGPNDLHELVVTAFDNGYKLSDSVEPKAWTNVTYSAILGTIAGQNALSLEASGLPGTVFEHLIQTTDDRTFLNEIAERVGVTWRIAGKKLIVGGTRPSPITVQWGRELRRFSSRFNGAGPTKDVRVRGWDIRGKKAHVGVTKAPSQMLSTADRSKDSRDQTYALASGKKKFVTNRVTDSQSEAETLAGAVRERLDSGLTQARGEVFGNPVLVPGSTVKVAGMGDAFGGEYVLSSVEHVYSSSGYVTRFHAGPRSASTLVDLVGGPPRPFHGATIGIVTANDDKDMKIARVKVKLPMLGDTVESDWARVVTLGGGPGRGLQITPTINDEVLVIFEGGDTRRPIVLGGLWNGSDQPPMPTNTTTVSGETKIWHLQTKAGHQLTFDETDNAQEHVKVLLKDGKTKLHLGVDKIELWSNDMPIDVKAGQARITLAQNNVTIEGMNITLKATQAVKVEATSAVEVTSNGQVKVNGAMVDVKSNGVANIEASAIVALKGAMVKIN